MSGMGGSGGVGCGAGREDLASRVLGWWMRLGRWVEHWWCR